MSWLNGALHETANESRLESLDTFRASIDPEWIDEALAAAGVVTMRRRRLPAEQVIWLVLGMALLRDRPIAEVASKLELALPKRNGETAIAPSSIVQARQRVGEEPLRWLFERCSNKWALESAQANTWRGLSLFASEHLAGAVAVRNGRDDIAGRRLRGKP